MIEQNKAVNGIENNMPKLPASACNISTTIISLLNKLKREFEYTLKINTTDNELPIYARISVFAIVHIMSRPIVKPERSNALKLISRAFSFISHNEEDIDIATSITAPIAPMIIPEKIIALKLI